MHIWAACGVVADRGHLGCLASSPCRGVFAVGHPDRRVGSGGRSAVHSSVLITCRIGMGVVTFALFMVNVR